MLCRASASGKGSHVHQYLTKGVVNAKQVAPWYTHLDSGDCLLEAPFESSVVEQLKKLKISERDPQIRYLLDFTLNRFSRWLRILGIDAALETDEEKIQRTKHSNIILFERCRNEKRTLITTCENFATLCSGGSNTNTQKTPIGESGKFLMYKNSVIHRVIPGFIMQGGDFVFGNGSGGESIFGEKFKDERAGLMRKHNCKGLLSMGNSGKNSNTSQFFFTFQATPQCDGKHAIFGRVISGLEVLDYVETFGTSQGEPSVPIAITECGVFTPLETPGAGYWFDQPDNEAYSGVSPVFMVQPRVAVVAPSPSTVARFRKQMENQAVVTAVYDEQGEVQSRIDELLNTFAVDVVVVAPACSNLVKSVPQSYGAFSAEEVVLEAKPVDALKAVWTRTWLYKRHSFPLDGATS